MTEIVRSCPLCGSSRAKAFDRREFRGQMVTNQICQVCGLVYQSPRMTEAESQVFYQAEYRQLYQGQTGPSPKDLAVQYARAGSTLEFILPWVRNLDNILDIGCSTGALLQQFQMYYHPQAIGIEPDDLFRQFAQSLNLEVVPSLEELAPTSLHSFTLISMMHVLEHLPDPVVYLHNLREMLLQPQGWLLLEVPNLYAHDCFEVAHLASFSPHTLRQVVTQAGFRVRHIRLHGMPRSQFIPLYITLLAQSDGHSSMAVRPEYLVRFKRQIGFLQRRLYTRLFPRQAWLPVLDNHLEVLTSCQE